MILVSGLLSTPSSTRWRLETWISNKLFFRSGLALETKSTLMLVSEPFNLPRKEKRKSFFSMENHWIFRLLLCLDSVYILFNVLKILGCIDIVSRLVPWTKATGLTDSLLLLVKKR